MVSTATTTTRIAIRLVKRGRGAVASAARARSVPRAPGRMLRWTCSRRDPRRGRSCGVRRVGILATSALVPREGGPTRIASGVVELLLDAQELVVLGHPLRAGRCTGLDLATIRGHREVGDGGVLGLARPVAHHAAEAAAVGELDGVEGLGQGADLVALHQQP